MGRPMALHEPDNTTVGITGWAMRTGSWSGACDPSRSHP
ncbi:MAG: hypothetical protein ACI867_000839 [Glaciecola sp.]|jgi:hypothetical protein